MDNYYYYQVNGCCTQPIYIRQPKAIVIHSQQRQTPLTVDIPPQNIIVKNGKPQPIIVRQQSPNVVIQNNQTEINDSITEHILQTTTASLPQFDGPAIGSSTGTANVIQPMHQTQQIQSVQPPIQQTMQPPIQQQTMQPPIQQQTMQPPIQQQTIQPPIQQQTMQPPIQQQTIQPQPIQQQPSMQKSQSVQHMQHMYAQQQQLQQMHLDAGNMYPNPNMMYGNSNNSINPYMYPNSYYPMQNIQMAGNSSDTGMGMGMCMGLGPGQGLRNKMDINNMDMNTIEMNDMNAYITAPLHNMNYKQMPTDYGMNPSPMTSMPMQHMDLNYGKVYDPNFISQHSHQYRNRNNGSMHFV